MMQAHQGSPAIDLAGKNRDDFEVVEPGGVCWKDVNDMPDQNTISLYGSIAGAIIAVAAVIVAWLAPIKAAKLSEELRKQTNAQDENKRLKQYIFATLMQERAAPYTQAAVQAFNLIDVVFSNNDKVKNAWAKYLSALDPNNHVPWATSRSYFTDLLQEMVNDLNVGKTGFVELTRYYAPEFLLRKLNVESMQLKIQEKDLIQMTEQASANTAPRVVKGD